MSLIDEQGERRVRMAYLAIVASHSVNGVSALHSALMRESIFADFARVWPQRFNNKTNGVTPRRWLAHANPGLAALIDSRIGPGWRRDLEQLHGLRAHADDARLPAHAARGQAGQQAAPGAVDRPALRPPRRSRGALRRARQAHPRVQAPAAQRAAPGEPLPAHPRRAGRRARAAGGDLLGQGGLGLPHGQAGDPPHQRRGRGHQRRSARR